MKKLQALILAAILIAMLAGCGSAGGVKMTMGTGDETGVYYGYGLILAQQMKDSGGVDVTVMSTDGSKANLAAIDSGEFQLGMAQSDVMTYAWQGRRTFQEGRVDSFRVLASLYVEAVQVVTLNPEIRSVEDLKGRTVSVGAPNSGAFFNAMDVLEASGLTLHDITPVYSNFTDSIAGLKSREIDAAILVAGVPTPVLQELTKTDAVTLLPINGAVLERVLSSCPFYTEHTIPAGTYKGQEEDIQTIGVKATLIVSETVDDQTVYDLTKAIFDNLDTIRSCNPRGSELSLESACEELPVPFHPGAAKFYQEQGMDIR